MADLTVVIDESQPVVAFESVSEFETYGASMVGALVLVEFYDNETFETTTEEVPWEVVSEFQGGAFGTGWTLLYTGGSTPVDWQFTRTLPIAKAIKRLRIRAGLLGNWAFDITTTVPDSTGTAGTATGNTFAFSGAGSATAVATATYRSRVSVAGVTTVDLFAELDVVFALDFMGFSTGPVSSWQFRADTDSLIAPPPPPPPPPPAPEPCVPVGVFPYAGFATIGGFLVPPTGDGPVGTGIGLYEFNFGNGAFQDGARIGFGFGEATPWVYVDPLATHAIENTSFQSVAGDRRAALVIADPATPFSVTYVMDPPNSGPQWDIEVYGLEFLSATSPVTTYGQPTGSGVLSFTEGSLTVAFSALPVDGESLDPGTYFISAAWVPAWGSGGGGGATCPTPVPLPTLLSDTYLGGPVGAVTARDYSYLMPIGKTPDQFQFTIQSNADDPMTISGVEWHGWYFNNTRRI